MPMLFSLLAVALLVAAAVTDLGWRRIPNGLVLALAGLGLVRLGFAFAEGAPVAGLAADLVACLALLVLGAFALQARILGGGDVKLFAAAALWVGLSGLLPFLMRTALAGGLLAVALLIWGLARREKARQSSLPYGVAIAVGGVLTIFAHP